MRAEITLVALMLLAGCRRPAAEPPPQPSPAPITAYTQYAPGDTVDLVRKQLGLDDSELRYRSGMPDGKFSVVYFLKEGNLHLDATRIGDTWVLESVPVLEPASGSIRERVDAWDRGSDPQRISTKGQK